MEEWRREYRTKFASNLKRLINNSEHDITTIASIGNIESKAIYRILADENEPKITTLLPIAKGLGIHPREFYNFEFSLKNIGK